MGQLKTVHQQNSFPVCRGKWALELDIYFTEILEHDSITEFDFLILF